jgi:CubicO group peptidase (beta-lactamase class C family)
MAYEVLGDVIAKVSGVPFEDYVDAHILQPLGMKSSTLLKKKADPTKLADGYTRPRGGDYASIHAITAYPYNRAHSPSSNLHSNALDMARWAMANLNRGELDGKRILKASTYDLMWKPAADVEFCRGADRSNCTKSSEQVGISWFLETKDGHLIVSHGGGDDGFITGLVLIPDQDAAFVYMQNSAHPGMTTPDKLDKALIAYFLKKQIHDIPEMGERFRSTHRGGVAKAESTATSARDRFLNYSSFGNSSFGIVSCSLVPMLIPVLTVVQTLAPKRHHLYGCLAEVSAGKSSLLHSKNEASYMLGS